MDPGHTTPATAKANAPGVERRHFDRSGFPPGSGLGQLAGTAEEVKRWEDALVFSAQQMAELRTRNERMMALNSELRFRLGEMTLQWIDVCSRLRR